MLAATAYEAIRAYVFAVIPLFMLMGEFIGKSGTVTDVYRGINRVLNKIPGRLAIATVVGNALFSFVTKLRASLKRKKGLKARFSSWTEAVRLVSPTSPRPAAPIVSLIHDALFV